MELLPATASHGHAGFVSDASPGTVQLTQLTTAASGLVASASTHEARLLQALHDEETAREVVHAATEKFAAGQQAGLTAPQLAQLERNMDTAVLLWDSRSKELTMLTSVLGVLNMKSTPACRNDNQPSLVLAPTLAALVLEKKPAREVHARDSADVSVEDGLEGDSKDMNLLGNRPEKEKDVDDGKITLSPSPRTPVNPGCFLSPYRRLASFSESCLKFQAQFDDPPFTADKHDTAAMGGKKKLGSTHDWTFIEKHGHFQLQEGGAQAYSVFCNTDMPATVEEGGAATRQQPTLKSTTPLMPVLGSLTADTGVKQ